MKKILLTVFFSVVFLSCSNRDIKMNESLEEDSLISVERVNYAMTLPDYAKSISYRIGSQNLVEMERYTLDKQGSYLEVEVYEVTTTNLADYIYKDLSKEIDRVHVLARKRVYIDDYIGIELNVLYDNELRKKITYINSRNYVYKFIYHSPYKIFYEKVEVINSSLKSLKLN